MKIAHYMTGIWDPGGVASYIRNVSGAQAAAGHEVSFYDHVSNERPAVNGASPIYVRDMTDLWEHVSGSNVDVLHTHIDLDWNDDIQRRVDTERRKTGALIVRTVHGHQPYCPSGTRYLANTSVPCDRAYNLGRCLAARFLDRCGSIRPNKLVEDFGKTRFDMKMLRYVPTITVSQFMRQQMIRSGYDGDNINVLYLPVNWIENYTPPPVDDTPHFLFLGRITPQKGVEWLIRAVKQTTRNLHVDIAGDGYIADSMKELVKQLGLSDKITFHGWQEREFVRQLFVKSRAMVFPSIWHEPGGTAAFESMVNGRAVIQSRVGGMPEVIHDDENGILVDPNDIAGLAAAMDRLAGDLPLATQLGATGRELVRERYLLERHSRSLMDLYTQYQNRSGMSAPVSESAK